MWKVEFYIKENGHIPAKEFLYSLSQKNDIPYIDKRIMQLQKNGNKISRPAASYLRDKIWELRIKTINGQLRLLYFFFDGDRIIITNGFKKKTREVPTEQIDLAIKYMKDYYERK